MSLGKRLKAEREKRNWSQIFVAKKIGITNTVLSNYERDYRDPDTETLKKLADLYEVKTDYLLGRSINDTSTSKDEKDIAKRMEKIKKDLTSEDGLLFNGEPMSEEAIESFLEAMEYAVRQTQRINKKYIPKKYRDKETE
jgi:transcriptional regulator with XRE-family HTH domain